MKMTNIITEPTVEIRSAPVYYPSTKYLLPTCEATDSEKLIAFAGKGCYDSYAAGGRPISDHISNLIASGHGSVLEHANVSLFIAGISRGCSHEIVRHRAGFAFSQRSTRYVDESDCGFVAEPYIADIYRRWEAGDLTTDEAMVAAQFSNCCMYSLNYYKMLIGTLESRVPEHISKQGKTAIRKWARGKARGALNHYVETRMTMTGNLRAWRNFIEQRSHRSAEAEIRRLSNAVYDKLYALAPSVFVDYVATEYDSYFEYSPAQKKV
jgi:thymidylate synthase (FAD)